MNRVQLGDALDLLAAMEPHSLDACVTDPAYGLSQPPNPRAVLTAWLAGQEFDAKRGGFMGEQWDSFVPGPRYWQAIARVLKPGAHVVAFGGTRTYDWLTIAMRLGGLEIRDSLHWLYARGMNKAGYLSLQLERKLCRKESGKYRYLTDGRLMRQEPPFRHPDADALWGWAGALKPNHEPIVLARKPFRGTLLANAIEHGGLGAMCIDRCRVAAPGETISTHSHREHGKGAGDPDYGTFAAQQTEQSAGQRLGRWPSNVLLTHAPECRVTSYRTVKGDHRAGDGEAKGLRPGGFLNVGADKGSSRPAGQLHGDERVPVWTCAPGCPVASLEAQAAVRDGVSRFYPMLSWDDELDFLGTFYANKVGRAEKDLARPIGFEGRLWNTHKTVKPVSVLEWLIKLVVPEGGRFVDPFVGSGTSLVAAERLGLTGCTGMEIRAVAHAIAQRRVEHARGRHG